MTMSRACSLAAVPPRLGQLLLLLCQERCQEQLHTLKDEGLLDWQHEPVYLEEYPGWMEYRDCIVLSANWEGIIPQKPELFDELRPRSRASISLPGGLRTGRRDAWIEGYTPNLVVTSFDGSYRISILDPSRPSAEPLIDEIVDTNTVIELPQFLSGDYLIQAISSSGSTTDRRYISVIAWEGLKGGDVSTTLGTPVGDQFLQGAMLGPPAISDPAKGP